MKKVLVVMLLLGSAGSVFSGSSGGRWVGPSTTYTCTPQRICVEWDEFEGEMDGAICCIDEADLNSQSFFPACQNMVQSPRSD